MISSGKLRSNAKVFLYKDINYRDYRGYFEGTNSSSNLHQAVKSWNDSISSVKVVRNAKVYAYKGINKQNYLTAYWGYGYDVKNLWTKFL